MTIQQFTEAKLDLSKPASDQIARYLKTAILNLELLPGQMISETEIGKHFGASRTPVREAFSRVRDDGMIKTYPSRGTFVSKLSVKQIEDAQFIREALELAIVERVATSGLATKTREALQENLSQQHITVANGDVHCFHGLDDAFHVLLANASENKRMAGILVREKGYLDRVRMLSLSAKEHMSVLLQDHQKVFQAICARSTSGAKTCMQIHLRRVLETLSDHVNANREYFE